MINEKEILNKMSDIEYGYVDNKGNIHKTNYDHFHDNYMLQSPEELEKSKVGVCWDQVELERKYFGDYPHKTFFIEYEEGNNPTHTFLTFKKNNKVYWLEHAFENYEGIHEYNTLEELLLDVKNKFIDFEQIKDYKEELLNIYEYTKPKYNISCEEFYNHCIKGVIK